MYLDLERAITERILLGFVQGVLGSICRSRVRRKRRRPRSWSSMCEIVCVGLCPKALDVKAFHSVSMAADWRERRRRSCCGVREGSGV